MRQALALPAGEVGALAPLSIVSSPCSSRRNPASLTFSSTAHISSSVACCRIAHAQLDRAPCRRTDMPRERRRRSCGAHASSRDIPQIACRPCSPSPDSGQHAPIKQRWPVVDSCRMPLSPTMAGKAALRKAKIQRTSDRTWLFPIIREARHPPARSGKDRCRSVCLFGRRSISMSRKILSLAAMPFMAIWKKEPSVPHRE